MNKLFIILLAFLLAGCAYEPPPCETVTVVFKDLNMDVLFFREGSDILIPCSRSGNTVDCGKIPDGSREKLLREDKAYYAQRVETMCAVTVTARMQDPLFRDSVIRIEK